MRVYYTIYDGFYVVVENGNTEAFEGELLLPKRVRDWLKTNKPVGIKAFYKDAISLGLCK